ncbi:hypothetical protein TWF730_008320 [Orbilia blumenaviensis]|uniref:Heterokaryon incompatibility domain-containing protein n=1 Tax=Orbilia blumenaviensis TaxID=1796055 RepID=A0AAV9V2B1_9PEZI
MLPKLLGPSGFESLQLLHAWNEELQIGRDSQAFKILSTIQDHASGNLKSKVEPLSLKLCHSDKMAWLFLAEFLQLAQIKFTRRLVSLSAACRRIGSLLDIHDQSPMPATRHSAGLDTSDCKPWHGPGKRLDLTTNGEEVTLPYYLWDIEARKTVRVKELPDVPSYCVISHTWGRWRTEAKVEIEGVGWLVPTNSKFNVEELPQAFAEHKDIFAPSKHLWFDLFCIPQDDNDPLKRREISIQGFIFGQARLAFSWLNSPEICGFKGLREVVHYLARSSIHDNLPPKHRGFPDLNIDAPAHPTHQVTLTINECNLPTTGAPHYSVTGLADSSETSKNIRDLRDLRKRDLTGWFTSLWTLQEWYLRPDMILIDKDWNPFTLLEDQSSPVVSLDTILALVYYGSDRPAFAPSYQAGRLEKRLSHSLNIGLLELEIIISITRTDLISSSDPIAILTLAERRKCTNSKRRAEAIMSVLGATKWYTETAASSEAQQPSLVLGRYPLKFLEEIQAKVGAHFFSSFYGTVSCFSGIYSDKKFKHEPPESFKTLGKKKFRVAGTLLPFDRLQPELGAKHFMRRGYLIPNEKPVEKWKLSKEGSVLMKEVMLVATTDRTLGLEPKNARVKILSHGIATEMEVLRNVPLEGTLEKVGPPGTHKYVVVIGESGTEPLTRCTILSELYQSTKEEGGRKYLAKSGDCLIGTSELIEKYCIKETQHIYFIRLARKITTLPPRPNINPQLITCIDYIAPTAVNWEVL